MSDKETGAEEERRLVNEWGAKKDAEIKSLKAALQWFMDHVGEPAFITNGTPGEDDINMMRFIKRVTE